jgi:hypothetical protein
MPRTVEKALNDSEMVNTSHYKPFATAGDHPGIAVLFDSTNETLKAPPIFGNFNSSPEVAMLGEPSYPEPFIWSGK